MEVPPIVADEMSEAHRIIPRNAASTQIRRSAAQIGIFRTRFVNCVTERGVLSPAGD
jgi:hypothetical protein